MLFFLTKCCHVWLRVNLTRNPTPKRPHSLQLELFFLSIAAQSKQQTLIKQVVSIFLFNLSDYHLIRGASGTTAINHKKLTSIKKKKNSELSQNRRTTYGD
jgi:hypothetical protein